MINLVMPMAGESSRFFDAGYDVPKYMLEAKGKTLFEYSLESLPLPLVSNVIFIFLKSHDEDWNVHNFILDKTDQYEFSRELVCLPNKTDGQAQTCLQSEPYVDSSDDLIIYNIDTYFESPDLASKLIDPRKKRDGIIGAFHHRSDDEKWSFASVDSDMVVQSTAEKQKISNYALTGLYHFTRSEDFFNVAKRHVEKSLKNKGEYYVAPMYNDLIENGREFVLDVCERFHPLGTPEDYEKFIG